jgi:hypothetical protein
MEDPNMKELVLANPIVKVAIELGIKVQGTAGRCFQEDRHPSKDQKPTLFFNPAKNTFLCTECADIGGTVVDLVCQYNGWDREKAIEWLAHRAKFDAFTAGLYHGKGVKRPKLRTNAAQDSDTKAR